MANNFAGLTSLKSLHNFESGALGTDSVGDNDMTTVGGATASSDIVFTEAMIALYILLSLAVESTSKITTGPQDTVKINATKDIQLIVH